jgi:N-glycosylase/DNA lyase
MSEKMNKFNFEIDIPIDSFNLEHIFECGQCFRWEKQIDDSYIGIIEDTVLKVTSNNNKLLVKGITKKVDIKEFLQEYFDLNNDYSMIKAKLSNIDQNLKTSIEYGYGIRILKQNLFECIISYIISANNNIPRIKKIINNISKQFGEEVVFEGNKYYLFPSIEQLSKGNIEDFKAAGAGFRDVRIYNTTQAIYSGTFSLDKLYEIEDINELEKELLKLDGVGPKVANCIMLFALKRFDVFPIDVWVRRIMNDLYIHAKDENKINNKEILKIAHDKFGNLSGLAQQYLFYWRREL